jgi:hypothetical protein
MPAPTKPDHHQNPRKLSEIIFCFLDQSTVLQSGLLGVAFKLALFLQELRHVHVHFRQADGELLNPLGEGLLLSSARVDVVVLLFEIIPQLRLGTFVRQTISHGEPVEFNGTGGQSGRDKESSPGDLPQN